MPRLLLRTGFFLSLLGLLGTSPTQVTAQPLVNIGDEVPRYAPDPPPAVLDPVITPTPPP